MHVIFHAFSKLQYIYTCWHRRRLPRDAKRESSGCTRSTRGKFYDTGSGATRKSRREHSSELQPEHNALLEDMMRLFLVPPRYVFWTSCMLLVDSIKRILYLTMSSKPDRSMVVTTWKKLPAVEAWSGRESFFFFFLMTFSWNPLRINVVLMKELNIKLQSFFQSIYIIEFYFETWKSGCLIWCFFELYNFKILMMRTESILVWMQIRSCHVVEFLLKNSKHLRIDYIIFILMDYLNTKII